jgi:hypothetical protein
VATNISPRSSGWVGQPGCWPGYPRWKSNLRVRTCSGRVSSSVFTRSSIPPPLRHQLPAALGTSPLVMFVSSTLLANLRSVNLAVLRPYPHFHHRRNFSFSPRPQAAEISDDFLANFKNTTFFRKIADKPEALSALVSFAKLLQEQGMSAPCFHGLVCVDFLAT